MTVQGLIGEAETKTDREASSLRDEAVWTAQIPVGTKSAIDECFPQGLR